MLREHRYAPPDEKYPSPPSFFGSSFFFFSIFGTGILVYQPRDNMSSFRPVCIKVDGTEDWPIHYSNSWYFVSADQLLCKVNCWSTILIHKLSMLSRISEISYLKMHYIAERKTWDELGNTNDGSVALYFWIDWHG